MLHKAGQDRWSQFSEDLREVFSDISLAVNFEEDTDEIIDVRFSIADGPQLPLDAAGTSILQATQLLAYVTLFNPALLILDEPDSHLHPDNQRSLCKLITKLAAQRHFQVVLSTHSRHVLDAMRGGPRVTWITKGEIVVPPADESPDLTALLLDLGALDSVDYFADGEITFLVATEDADPGFVKHILWSSGFNEDETEVVSYSGCSKVDAAIVLGRFLKEKAPNVRMIVHRDRDYLSDDDVQAFEQALGNHDITAFVTEGSDVEGYYVNADHLHHCNPGVSHERIQELLDQAIADKKDKSIEAIVNLRTEEAFRKRNKGGDGPNHGQIAVTASADYDATAQAMMRGKLVLKRIKALIQEEQGANAVVLMSTPHLSVPQLANIANPPVPANDGAAGDNPGGAAAADVPQVANDNGNDQADGE